MAAVFGFEESDIRIRKDFLPSLGKDANKGVIGRVQNEGGHGDAIYNIRCRGSGIVINCAGKTAIVSGNLVIKFAKSGHAAEARSLKYLREKSCLGAEPPTQLPNEIIFVQTIAAVVQRIRGGGEIHCRAHGCDGAKL